VDQRGDDRLVTGRFAVVTLAALCYFMGLGLLLPVIPLYIRDDLGGGGLAIGIASAAMGLSAMAFRPFIGPLGDERGRRFLLQTGSAVAALSMVLLVWADSVPLVIGCRVLTGVGEAAAFVGAAASVQDFAPPHRRGEAASYFSVAVYASLAAGPLLGEWIYENRSFAAASLTAAALCALAVVFGAAAPSKVPDEKPPKPDSWLHPAALRPGITLMFGLLGYIGFVAFGAVHAEDIGLAVVGAPFAVFAVIVVSLRVLASGLPDRLGAARTTAIAMSASALGLLVMGVFREPIGLFIGTAILASGQAFLFPGLFANAVDNAPESERSHAVASFAFFFDGASALGGLLMGAIVATTNTSGAFIVGSAFCVGTLLATRTKALKIESNRGGYGAESVSED
jgi:MFS family permease